MPEASKKSSRRSSIDYLLVNLSRFVKNTSVERAQTHLSSYVCPQNKDIEDFLHTKAIDFASQGIAQTHLVFSRINSIPRLLGYFTLANKIAAVPLDTLSKSYQKRVSRFGVLTPENTYMIPMPLIAQLGKNYSSDLTESITGAELLQLACDKVATIQSELGGRCVYLECEDSPFLTNFYYNNGFRRFSPRDLEAGQLIRMIKYQ